MRAMKVVVLAGALLGARALGAQQARPDVFRPLEFLVGSCWIGTFPDGKKTDEHCFEWVFDRKFIRDRHVVRGGGPYEGESLYGWDPVAKQLAFWYWNSGGMISTGHIDDTADGIVFPGRYSTSKGEVELKAVWTRLGTDGYRVWSGQRTAEGWKTLWTMDLARKR
jgi:hypothetical protein